MMTVATSACLVLTMLVSCGGKKTEASAALPEGLKYELDLSRYGKPFSIAIPDTAAAKLQVTEQSNGALDIRVGNNYAISINEQAADLNQIREDLKGDEVNKLKSMIADEASALMWESEVVQPEFHFCVNQKINNSDYSFEDIRSTETEPFGREAVQRMYNASKAAHAANSKAE